MIPWTFWSPRYLIWHLYFFLSLQLYLVGFSSSCGCCSWLTGSLCVPDVLPVASKTLLFSCNLHAVCIYEKKIWRWPLIRWAYPRGILPPNYVYTVSARARARSNMSESQLPRYTWEEISLHNSASSLWIVLSGKVYDVTNWREDVRILSHWKNYECLYLCWLSILQHPGGEEVLLEGGGNAPIPFQDY